MDILIRQQFGVPANAWSLMPMLKTADATRAGVLIRAAATAQAMVWVTGDRGCGKTRAVRREFLGCGALVAEPLRPDRERLRMGDILSAIVTDLSDETPRQSVEARAGQVRRLLSGLPRPPVLFIDDAHELHKATVKGLKRLRELAWRGRAAPMLGIVLAGQSEVRGVPEVGLRSDRVGFAGLTSDEAGQAIVAAMNEDRATFDAGAIGRLVQSDRARNWLDLEQLCDECLAKAHALRSETVDARIADAVLRPRREADRRPAATASASGDADEAYSERLRRGRAAA